MSICKALSYSVACSLENSRKRNSRTSTGPPPPKKIMGQKLTGTNDFAYFSRKIIWTRQILKYSRGFDNCDSLVQELQGKW